MGGTVLTRAAQLVPELVAPSFRADPAAIGALRLDLAADVALALLSPDAPVGVALQATTLTPEGWGSQ